MVTRKIPMRKCVGCNEMKEKKTLVRIVRTKEGEVSVDLTGKKSGRGAYICKNEECLKKARKAKRLEGALQVEISPEVYDRMQMEIKDE